MFGLRLLWRDWRGGELGILASALIIAVAIVTGISLFADRIQGAIVAQSSQFLAADRVLVSPRHIDDLWLFQAQRSNLQQAQILAFQSMVYAGGELDSAMHIASVKAVSDSYPLRGQLEVSDQTHSLGVKTTSSPMVGKVWLEPRLLSLLGLSIGDSLYVGAAKFTISKVVLNEPDRGGSAFSFGPRVLMNLADIPATKIVQPGSRVQYRYLYAGDASDLEKFGSWLSSRLQPSHKWLNLEDSQPQIATSIEKAKQFLLLAGAMGVGLAGIAIALAAQRYSERHFNYVAVMKSLGAKSLRIMWLYLSNLLMLAALATIVGCALGWLIQTLFIELLKSYFDVSTAVIFSPRPFIVGAVTAFVCLLAFAIPPLLSLVSVSPLRVLRRDLPNEQLNRVFSVSFGVLGIAALILWYSANLKLTLAVIAGMGLTFVIVGGVAWYVLRGATLVGMQAGSQWRLALASLRRRGFQNSVQIVIFSLSIMLLLLLALVRGSLIEEWQNQLPQGTPNHFLVNMALDEVEPVEELLKNNQLPSETIYPMVRARLVSINGLTVSDHLSQFGRSQENTLDRELNMSWSASIPKDNALIEGQWWQNKPTKEVSIATRVAEPLQVGIGDKLQFQIGSETLIASVSSIRTVNWDTMKPNFYMLFPPGVLDQFPATYMTSFYLPAQKKSFINQLLRSFPTITVIELDAVIKQIQTIVGQVSRAIELVLGLIVVSGLVVLVASVQASLDSRLQESAVLRTLGASRGLVLGALVIEFSVLGLLAGLLAAGSAELAVFLLQSFVLEMDFVPHPWIWIAGPIMGAILIGFAGFMTCRRVVNTPPVDILRELP